MKIYVINLARAPERLQKMQAQFTGFGLEFERVEASDGKLLTDQDRALVDHDRRKRISPYPLTDNEIGCWLSHLRAMKNLIASGDAMAVIMEDDAALSPDFPRVVAAIEKQGAPFDVVDLHRLFKKGEVFALCRPLLPSFGLGRVGYMQMHATAYVMSRAGAQKFVAHATRFAHAIDKDMHSYWSNGLDIYGLENPVARQDDGGYSYIDETRGQDRPKERERYPDADRFYWRMQRRLTKLVDSIQKRTAFPAYVKRGREAKQA
jgi:glycosyl transferase, family 25